MSEVSKIIEKLKTAPDDELCELELGLSIHGRIIEMENM